jgi:D-glycero-alpha-D-manno-heptose-7-phosphate kinase
VTVALIGALDALTPGHITSHEVAAAAQAVETQDLGLQCGIQDQLCAAYGGINFIEMIHYPLASVAQLQPPSAVLAELEARLALVYLGKSHQSSNVHQKVITQLENAGADCAPLNELRTLATTARNALAAGDFSAFGKAMNANTAAQARLHPDLVSKDARRVIEIAQKHGATGWKVNGAGGDGGSLTLLCTGGPTAKRGLLDDISQAHPDFRIIPITLDQHGLQVW